MSAVKPTPFSSRTKSLRERFSSKRSYSENFKDPPPPSTSKQTDSAGRNVRPSMPNIGMTMPHADNTNSTAAVVQASMMQHIQQQQQLQQGPFQPVTVLSEHFNPFAALPEETYCSALDINSQEGDPRFPWQRDAAVQCDLSPNGEGYRSVLFLAVSIENQLFNGSEMASILYIRTPDGDYVNQYLRILAWLSMSEIFVVVYVAGMLEKTASS